MSQQNVVGTHPPYFDRYISLVQDQPLDVALAKQITEARALFSSLPASKWLYRYDEGKWTVKEVLQHITDTERVFAFRALVFARRDPNTFPSFNENEYAIHSLANEQDPADLLEEFLSVRQSSIRLFGSFDTSQLGATGRASNYEMSVDAIGYMIPGHFQHHVNILREKYL